MEKSDHPFFLQINRSSSFSPKHRVQIDEKTLLRIRLTMETLSLAQRNNQPTILPH
jgi:hypothetical protein